MIDRYVRGEKARAIYKRRLIDRVKFEALAEEFDTSVRNVQNIVYRAQEQLFKHL
jgi:DNA-directed RNA polymerase specialized sigma24 family protein